MASKPRTVEEIFRDFRARRNAIIRALTHGTTLLFPMPLSFLFFYFFLSLSFFFHPCLFLFSDVDEFYGLCDPGKGYFLIFSPLIFIIWFLLNEKIGFFIFIFLLVFRYVLRIGEKQTGEGGWGG